MSKPAPDPFSEEEIHLLERFAQVFSLGYLRFLDLQAAEERVRQQARELAVEHVRNEALSMRSGDDLLRVVAVMFRELLHTGTQRSWCNIFFVDEDADQFIQYNAHLNSKKFGVSWASTKALEFLEFDEEVEAVTAIPGRLAGRAKFSESDMKEYLRRGSWAEPWNFTRELMEMHAKNWGSAITPAYEEFYLGEHQTFALSFAHGAIQLAQRDAIGEEDKELRSY